jgi:hypothetical protein
MVRFAEDDHMTTPQNDIKQLIALVIMCAVLSLVCFGIIAYLHQPDWPANWQKIVAMAIMVCNAATIPPVLMSSGVRDPKLATTMVLFTTIWRLGTVVAVLIFWAATKWPHSEFAAKCLVGCYFPFLLLESWHSIRHTKH